MAGHRIRFILVLFLPLVLGALAVVPATAVAASPVALVVAVEGPTEPPITPYTELTAGAPILLGAGARIAFLHYATCEEITVAGGRLSFTSQRFQHSGGKVVDRKRATCPKMVNLGGDGRIGGLLLRSLGAGGPLKVSTTPSMVVVGGRAVWVTAIAVMRDDTTVLRLPADGPILRWPADAPPLDGNSDYDMVVSFGFGEEDLRFTVRAMGNIRASEMTLIRVD